MRNDQIYCGGCSNDCSGRAAFELMKSFGDLLSDLFEVQQLAIADSKLYDTAQKMYEAEANRWLKKARVLLLENEAS